MSIVITGATGNLGRLVTESLLERGVAADEIVAAGRRTKALDDLADRGVRTSQIDYADPASLRRAFAGAERVLLVSSSELGQRTAQHQNVIDAASATGVALLAYTSVARADTSSMQLAAEHKATELALRAADVPFVLLRNSWYLENYTDQLATILATNAILGSARDGRVSAATRADYAAAAAAVLTSDRHEGATYELGGDDAFTLGELADEISRQTGREVAYRDLPVDDYAQALASFGIPDAVAGILADSDRGISNGDLFVDTRDLSRLTGRPTTALSTAITDALSQRDLTPASSAAG